MKKIVGKILGSVIKVGKKVADDAVMGGAIQNISEDNGTPAGKLNKERLIATIISSTVPVILLIGLAANWWTIDEMKQIVKVLRDVPTRILDIIEAIAS